MCYPDHNSVYLIDSLPSISAGRACGGGEGGSGNIAAEEAEVEAGGETKTLRELRELFHYVVDYPREKVLDPPV